MQTFINVPPMPLTAQCIWAEKPISMHDIAAEKCLLSASPIVVKANGGPLARSALEHILQYYKNEIARAEKVGLSPIIDTRVHRLSPGQFPAVPGWHCDGVPRHTYHGQPVFEFIKPEAFTVTVHLSNEVNGVSNTQYVDAAVKPKIWDNKHVYRDLHMWIEAQKPTVTTQMDGQFMKMTPKTIHRATACHRRGWRFWLRFTMYDKPPLVNGINAPQQVYQLSEEAGW